MGARAQDSPSSVASSRAPTMPESSYKGSSREDSISSGGFFSDLESLKADDIPVIVSRTATDEWSQGGLGITDDTLLERPSSKSSEFPPLTLVQTAPPTAMTGSSSPPLPPLRRQPSLEMIRSKRESIEKIRTNQGVAEEGDDEDEELGQLQIRQRSPIGRTNRTASKLGHEMLRTNSRGSVISMHDDRSAEENSLRRSIELLDARMGGLSIPEESFALLGSVQPRRGMRNFPEHAHPEPERPGSRGHITPPILFPQEPGHTSKEFDMDEQATPMPNKVIDFGEQPTPRARSENGSSTQQQDI